MDHRIIRVDIPSTQAGIASALRRAFHTPPLSREQEDHQFDELLARIH